MAAPTSRQLYTFLTITRNILSRKIPSQRFPCMHELVSQMCTNKTEIRVQRGDSYRRTTLKIPARKQTIIGGEEIKQTRNESLGEFHSFSDSLNISQIVKREQIENKRQNSSEVKIPELVPSLKSAGNIAAYVRHSEALTKLVELGVDLSSIEANAKATDMFIKFDFEKNVKPYLLFLHSLEVPDNMLAQCITRNPMIFAENIHDLQLCIEYLKSKQFSKEAVISLVTRAPQFLSLSTKEIDGKLGFLQKKFNLTGNELRAIVAKQPKLLRVSSEYVRWHAESLGVVGFSAEQIKQMLIANPKMYLIGTKALVTRHEYLHNVMLLPLEQLVKWPQIYNTRESRIAHRHLFLSQRNRAQYDPTKENFISLYRLVSTDDPTFAAEVAMATVTDYNVFLKTI